MTTKNLSQMITKYESNVLVSITAIASH